MIITHFFCVCSHVGYTSAHSRLATCPGQSARKCNSRSETCPGQRAHHPHRRFVTCPGQCARNSHSLRSNCPGQSASIMAQSRERSASMESDLAEIKFWTFSIGCKNLRQCVRDAPSSTRSFDVSQSEWWKEPGLSQRREALRELTTCEVTHVVDFQNIATPGGSPT